MRIGSGNGTPPSSRARAGASAPRTGTRRGPVRGRPARRARPAPRPPRPRPAGPRARARRRARSGTSAPGGRSASSTPMCSVSRRAGDAGPAEVAHEHGRLGAVQVEPRQFCVVLEGRRAVAGWRPAGPPRAGRRAPPRPGPGPPRRARTPWPAVMRLSWPGRISCSEPRLSRCSSSPARSQVTVCRPIWGCGPMPKEAPGVTGTGPAWSRKHQDPDRASRPLRQHPAHRQGPDLGQAPRRELHDRSRRARRRRRVPARRRPWPPVRSSPFLLHP